MSKKYVEKVEGTYRIAGSTVSLGTVVYSFWKGESPEKIAQSFSTLTLEQVYGAIAFYLANQEEIDASIEQGEVQPEAKASSEDDPSFYETISRRMAEARRKLQASQEK